MVQYAKYIPFFEGWGQERQQTPELPVEERTGDFREVELGFTREQAMLETRRCLSCRKCLGCGLCGAVCHARAIDLTDSDEEIEIDVDSIVLTPGAERICSSIEEKFGYGKYLNVISFLEFERMLSDSGPYGGLFLRPYDGEIPRKIAFVPCYKEGLDKLSFSYATAEALYAGVKMNELESHLFFSDIGAGEPEEYFGKSLKTSRREAEVVGIEEKEVSRNLIIKFIEDGQAKEEEFEMVVLLTWLELPPYVKELNEKLGLRLERKTFWETEDISFEETSKPGVFFAGYSFL